MLIEGMLIEGFDCTWRPLSISVRQRPRVLERSCHRMEGGGSYHTTRNNRNTVHDLERL